MAGIRAALRGGHRALGPLHTDGKESAVAGIRAALWRADQSFRERTSRTTTSTSLNCRVEHLDLGVSNRTVRREEQLAVNTRLFNSKG